ncbi:hypothetical protein KUTeg_024057, partial [Tegillarca granosa]
MFIGLAGTAAVSGLSVTIYEWHAEIYTGAVFMQQILGWNIYLCVIIILAVTAVYTSIGGLASVIYTDTLQTVILVGGASAVFVMVQRCLAARNLSHAKAGSLLAAVLKITSFALFVIPGMIARILYTEEVACARPSDCKTYCDNEAGCSNIAYPLLVLRLLPSGTASSIVTLDLWKQFRKGAKETELMIVGRLTVLVLVGISILWLPILQQSQGGILWFYVQSIRAYLVPPWCMLFILAIFWKRTTEKGAFFGLMIGLITGLIRMVLDFIYLAPACGSGKADERPDVLAKVDFLHFAIILSAVSAIAIVVISLLTEPRPENK